MKSSALRRRERRDIIDRKSGLFDAALDEMARRLSEDDLPTYEQVLAARDQAHQVWEAWR